MARRRRSSFGSPAAEHADKAERALSQARVRASDVIRNANRGDCEGALSALVQTYDLVGQHQAHTMASGARRPSEPEEANDAYEAVGRNCIR